MDGNFIELPPIMCPPPPVPILTLPINARFTDGTPALTPTNGADPVAFTCPYRLPCWQRRATDIAVAVAVAWLASRFL